MIHRMTLVYLCIHDVHTEEPPLPALSPFLKEDDAAVVATAPSEVDATSALDGGHRLAPLVQLAAIEGSL